MAPRVILLSGPAGVGKTTVGRMLAGRAPNGACIHGDQLKEFIVSRAGGAVATGLAYVNGASVAANFVEAGYDLVVFEFVFEERRFVNRFLGAFPLTAPVHLFTLWAPLATVTARERTRPNRDRLGERVVACYETIDRNRDVLGIFIDTEGATPEAIAEAIFHQSAAGIGLISMFL
ncbi:MAG: AAA family ATPase [Thermomicrobiales bacterium]